MVDEITFIFFFFKQKTAYEIRLTTVGSQIAQDLEMVKEAGYTL